LINWSIIDERPKDEADYQRLLRSKEWRLNNLYWIKPADPAKQGNKIIFRMNVAQRQYHENKHTRNVILKARQLGFTTYIQIDMLDECLFKKNFQANVIAHVLKDAQSFFKNKIKFAYDNLPGHIKSVTKAKNDSAQELEFSNGSNISVGVSARSGTCNYLHISEFGKLCAKRPEAAREVKSGAFPAAEKGIIVIESTAEGRMGEFYNISTRAQKNKQLGKTLTYKEFRFNFFPWFDDPTYKTDPEHVIITSSTRDYFKDLSKILGRTFSEERVAWYQLTLDEQGDDMKREYPSTPEEAFEQSTEGAYFKTQMAQIRAKKQICRIPIEPSIPIQTFWDLGLDTTSVWFFQQVGFEYRFVDYYQNSNEHMDFYIRMLKDKTDGGVPYLYGDMYLPHDGGRRSLASKENPADILYNNGYTVRIVQRTSDESLQIGYGRQVLPKCYFDVERCDEGLIGLDNFRKEWDEKREVWGG